MCYILKNNPYICGMEVPKVIKRAAAWYLKNYPKAKIVHLGAYKDADAYFVKMPDNAITGYPPVLLLRDNKVSEVCDEQSLAIISSLLS